MMNALQLRHRLRGARALLLAAAVAGLAACGGSWDTDDDDDGGTPPTSVGEVVALTASARVISFDKATPGTLKTTFAVTGLMASEQLVGIDYRPSDRALYALSNQGRIYTLAPDTGVATLKVTLKAAPNDDNAFTALTGTSFGVDFNPVADRLRVVSDTKQNLRINVDNGEATTDADLNGGASGAAITASAYTNSFVGPTTTQLYALDAAAGMLYLQNPPNNGTLTVPLSIGVSATAANGFDIDPRNNIGYAALAVGGATRLYTLPVGAASATATSVGTIGSGDPLLGLALRPLSANPQVIVLTDDSRLASFDPATPNTLSTPVAISSLAAGETVLGIDFRPKDGLLYALTTAGRVLTVDPASGIATFRATLVADPADTTTPFAGIGSTVASVDFNPFADKMRVVTDTGANLRIDVDNGRVITDTTISRSTVPPSVVAAAYTNSFAGASATRLYDIDSQLDVLTEQAPPNDGTLVDIGSLGAFDVTTRTAFDIAGGDNGLVLAALRTSAPGPFSLYTVSLTTGAATLYRNTSGNAALSQIGGTGGPVIVDLAIRY